MRSKYWLLILVLGLSQNPLQAQPAPPVGVPLVFIAPLAADSSAPVWLGPTLTTTLKRAVEKQTKGAAFAIKAFPSELLERPFALKKRIWRELFQRPAPPGGENYLVVGRFRYVGDELNVSLQLYFLNNLHLVDHYQDRFPLSRLLKWERAVGQWFALNLKLGPGDKRPMIQLPGTPPPPKGAGSLESTLSELEAARARRESTPLSRGYRQAQEQEKALAKFWQDISHDPYQAEIHDIQTRRDPAHPDSLIISFKVTYCINPRILDALMAFYENYGEEPEKTGGYLVYTFEDLNFIPPDFLAELSRGSWRLLPIVSLGAPENPEGCLFYHSAPFQFQPQHSKAKYAGGFPQLILAVPGVSSLRLYVSGKAQTFSYEARIARQALEQLKKIQVRFLPEAELARWL